MTKLDERRINETRNFLKTNHDVVFSYSMLCESLGLSKTWLSRNLDVIVGDDKHMDIYYDRGRKVGIKYCSNPSGDPVNKPQTAKEKALELLNSSVIHSLSDKNYIGGKKLAKKLAICESYLRSERDYFLSGCPDLDYKKGLGYRRKANNMETESRYGDKKNEEGYQDPTVFKALSNQGKALAGEVWSYEVANGTSVEVLVINGNKTMAQIVFLQPNTERLENPKELTMGKRSLYYDPLLIQSRRQRFLQHKICTLDIEKFNEVRSHIFKAMGAPKVITIEKKVPVEVEKVVEKIVEKKVPVEVEKIVEVKTPVMPKDEELDTLKAIELAKLRTEVEIYKSFCSQFMDMLKSSTNLVKGGE